MPAKTKKYIQTWRKVCPDYEIKEWNETNFDVEKYKYAKQAYDNKKWAFVSDVCRVEKVYEYGGVYLDVNTEVLKPFDDLLKDGFFIGFEQDEKVAPSVFGAKRGHWLLKTILGVYSRDNLFLPNGEMDLSIINDRFQNELLKIGLKPKNALQSIGDDIKVYPKEYFQPRYWNSPRQDLITKNTYTIHYFGASWHDEKTKKFFKLIMSEDAPLISVIIPIYNVERYLEKCVESVVSQSYINLEIILVDDKTPDRSGKIADNLAKKDERIKVIHKKKNEGLNMARATGFASATGDFVTFVDSDDMLAKGCLMKALEVLIKNEIDIVRFDGRVFNDKEEKEALGGDLSDDRELILKNKADLYRTQFGLEGFSYPMTVWGGLYRTEVVKGIDWKKSNFRMYEDNFWTISLLENVDSVLYRNFKGYLYRQNESDESVLSKKLIGNKFNGKAVGHLETWDLLEKRFRQVNKKYNLGMAQEIDNFMSALFTSRVKNLVSRNEISSENNPEFLVKNIRHLTSRVDLYEERLKDSELTIQRLNEELSEVQTELESHMKIRRSGRLFLGNIRRRIKREFENRKELHNKK